MVIREDAYGSSPVWDSQLNIPAHSLHESCLDIGSEIAKQLKAEGHIVGKGCLVATHKAPMEEKLIRTVLEVPLRVSSTPEQAHYQYT